MLQKLIGKSLFRASDRSELTISYMICFSLATAFSFAQEATVSTFILASYLKNFTDYALGILAILSVVVLMFHYQIVNRKKTEVYCRILVGDTLSRIRSRYSVECLAIVLFIYAVFRCVGSALGIDADNYDYLLAIFITYILISAFFVRGHESIRIHH